jgi:hypothetical protein
MAPSRVKWEICTPWVRYQIGISARGPIEERGGREKRNATRPFDVRAIVLPENSAVKKKGRKYVNPYRPVVNGLELTQIRLQVIEITDSPIGPEKGIRLLC